MKKGTQLLEIYALEIQMYTAQKNNKKLKVFAWNVTVCYFFNAIYYKMTRTHTHWLFLAHLVFSAFMLLVGWQGRHACKKLSSRWLVISGARCPADVTATLASVKSRLVLPFWYWLIRVGPDKGPLNRFVCVLAK